MKKETEGEIFMTSNGIKMKRCFPLNWKIEPKYADGSGPDMYMISLGGLTDSHTCFYDPEEKTLKVVAMSGQSRDNITFKCKSFSQGSMIAYMFAQGQGYDPEGTIYWNEDIEKREAVKEAALNWFDL